METLSDNKRLYLFFELLFGLALLVFSGSAGAQTEAPDPVAPAVVQASGDSAAVFHANLFELIDSIPLTSSVLSVVWLSITDFQGWAGFIKPLGFGILTIAAGWLGFLIIRPSKLRKTLNERAAKQNSALSIFLYSTISLLLELASVGIFYVFGHAAAAYLFDETDPNNVLIHNVLWAITAVLLFNATLRTFLSPKNSNLRLMPIDDRPVKIGFAILIGIFAVLQFGMAAINFVEHMGAYQPLVGGAVAALTLTVNLAFIAFVWASRPHFNAVFFSSGAPDPNTQPASSAFYRLWPVALSVWLIVIWGVWSFNLFIHNPERAADVAICWWITLSFPVLDRCVQLLLKNLIADRVFTAPVNQHRGERFVNVIQTGFRVVLLFFAVFTVTRAWGFQAASNLTTNQWVQQILNVIVELGVVAVVGFAIWEIVQGWAESKMPESEIDPVAALELDGGGMGGTRTETLLPLLRTVLSAVLAVFLVLSALYVLGVKIGPLLAGAGVIGIAVGFGAQKLVQDIISGIFFLIDDAFRMGEYVEVGGMKGTIEKISIRSMQLRHHLGAVQTIPYSEMATVKNQSRDWVTMKLEIRVPYNTDVEQLRKIVKKTGLALKEHPEHGHKFLLPLKSQGVNRIEESALIIRVKFTCRPGDQWIIRRLAFQEIRDNLSKAGIHFAHREVRVHVPGESADDEAELINGSDKANPAAVSDLAGVTPADGVKALPSAEPPVKPKVKEHATTSEDRLKEKVASAASISAIADELAKKYDTVDDNDND